MNLPVEIKAALAIGFLMIFAYCVGGFMMLLSDLAL